MILCKYGCKQEAKFQLKSGQWICSKSFNSCPINKKKNSNSLKKAHEDGKMKGWGELWKTNKLKSWNTGLTKNDDIRLKKLSDTFKEKMKNGWVPAHIEWTQSDKGKQKLSEIRSDFLENHSQQCKWFEFNIQNKKIRVQGTWEKRVAEYLIKNNIQWKRVRINFDKIKNYTPDFYLPEYNIYIEVKGWMRERDIIKMKKVIRELDIDLRLIDSLKILNELENKLIYLKDLPIFKNKYH